MRQHKPDVSGRKSPAALLVLANARDANEVAESILKRDGAHDVSTFYGFYVLQALAKSGDYQTALDFISTYWGAMLDFGATTFWEDFDLEWTENAVPIDQLVPPGKRDIHGDCGAHCYVGFRHSLCHGWASGPTAWLSQHVLGVQPLEPGFARVRVVPNLGNLEWAEGAYPTPKGPIVVRHRRLDDGSIQSTVEAPEGVEVVQRMKLIRPVACLAFAGPADGRVDRAADPISSRYHEPYPTADSKKGLQVELVDDALQLGIQHATFNVNLCGLIDPAGNSDNPSWDYAGQPVPLPTSVSASRSIGKSRRCPITACWST